MEKGFRGRLSMESRPQNPEFRNNPENFHLCNYIRYLSVFYVVPT